MTHHESQTIPAGWYPDPEGLQRQRWWDGERWTAHFAPLSTQQPYTGAAPQGGAPTGTDWNTPWIWLALVLPLLPTLPLLFVDWSGLVAANPGSFDPDIERQLSVYASPAYLTSVIGGWLAWALAVVFCYLDFKTLRDRGVPAPFHWAWAFLGSVVYAIGRGVVTNRRMGAGMVVVWAAVGLIVLILVVSLVVTAVIIGAASAQFPGLFEPTELPAP
jgi:hypothetical protein